MEKRGCGILLHIASLPSQFGIGDLGPWAYKFAEFLAHSRQHYWQILPLNPTNLISGNSPYSSLSAFAGSTMVISPELLQQRGLLTKDDIANVPSFSQEKVRYAEVIEYKTKLFKQAFSNYQKSPGRYEHDYRKFCSENEYWLEDFASFIAFKNHFDSKLWSEWSKNVRDREPAALNQLKEQLRDQIELEKFLQFLFNHQWQRLKKFCNERNIQIIGDIPYYVNYDSADVWMNPKAFKLDRNKRPTHVGGVPPDYFSKTGQLWGNPIYRWDVMQQNGYVWWIARMKQNFSMFDWVRIDHFRGMVAYWEVPAEEETAIHGKWVNAPIEDFLNKLKQHFPNMPIIAEDLGVITDDVKEIIQKYKLPGMRVLQFAFDESLPRNPYAPHNHIQNCLVYTGTHDNNTVRGWFENEAPDDVKKRLFRYLGREIPVDKIHWEFVRMALKSVANMVILPMQDILGLGAEAKMNRPATTNGNWQWRLKADQLTQDLEKKLAEMTEIYGRNCQ